MKQNTNQGNKWRMKFSFTLPFLILLLSINIMIFDQDFYKHETPSYAQYEAQVSNLLDYFEGSSLNTEFYSDREITHLADVRKLIWISWGIILLLLILILYSFCKDKKQHIRKQMIYGGIYSFILTLLLSLTLLSFSSSFIAFHKIVFTNDLWLLPASSTLIQMFPEEFFLQSTMQIVLYSLIFSVLSIILGWKIPGEAKHANKRT